MSICQVVCCVHSFKAEHFCRFLKMDNIEIRAVIKYLWKKYSSPREIQVDMVNVLGEDAPSFKTVCKWVNEFKKGRTSVNDDPRSGRPKTATSAESVQKVLKFVKADRRSTLQDIAEATRISRERVSYILNVELDMSKRCARWVPRLLTTQQKLKRVECSTAILERFRQNPTDFLRKFVTCDETWVHHYTPENKQQSKQWTKRGEPAPKKAKVSLSAGKVMASVFWDAKGILLIDYLPKGQTITALYYSKLLDRLKAAIVEKRPGRKHKKIIFHQDNAPVHTSGIVKEKLAKLKFETLDHPPYSPDLAPSDYHLFPKLKKHLGGMRFASDEELIATVDHYFEELEENEYCEGIKKLEHRLNKCIDLEGDYVEK